MDDTFSEWDYICTFQLGLIDALSGSRSCICLLFTMWRIEENMGLRRNLGCSYERFCMFTPILDYYSNE
jgi:hypothetical protein